MKRRLICHDIIFSQRKHPKQICPLFCLISPLSNLNQWSIFPASSIFFYQADQFFQPHQLFIPSLHCPALSIFPAWSIFYTYSKNTIQPDQWCSKGHAQPLDEHQQVRTLIWLWSGSGRRNEIESGKIQIQVVDDGLVEEMNLEKSKSREFQQRISESQEVHGKMRTQLHLVDKEVWDLLLAARSPFCFLATNALDS